MTNAEILNFARELTDTVDDNYISASFLWTALNTSHKHIYLKATEAAEDYNLSTTVFSTSSNVDTYSLMGNVHKIRRVEYIISTGASRALEEVREVFPRDMNEQRNASVLDQYSIEGSNLVFYPQPGASTSVRVLYVPKPNILSTSTGSPDIEPEYHHLLSYGAGLFIKTREDSNRQSLREDYAELLDQFIQSVETRNAQKSRHIIDHEDYS